MYDANNPYQVNPGESDWYRRQRQQELDAINKYETEQRMSKLLAQAGGDARSVRNQYRLTDTESKALDKADAKAKEQAKMDEAFLKGFTQATAANGYYVPRD